MAMKTYNFGDNSQVVFEITEDNKLTITLQARHLGELNKVTSSTVVLNPDELESFINWLGDNLLEDN